MQNITTFEPNENYIFFSVLATAKNGEPYKLVAILDSGAPSTEFSDETLQYLGFLDVPTKQDIELKHGLQTNKYGRIVLPHVEICSHSIHNLQVYVSHFEKSWGVDVLVGLDFFRKFRTTIDYQKGQIITEPYKIV